MYGSTSEEDGGLFSAGFPFMTVPYNQLIIFTSQNATKRNMVDRVACHTTILLHGH